MNRIYCCSVMFVGKYISFLCYNKIVKQYLVMCNLTNIEVPNKFLADIQTALMAGANGRPRVEMILV